MKSVKTKKIFVSALFALSLFFGISAATLMKNNSAAAEVSSAIEVIGAAVRYPEGAESAPKGTGLKFEVKFSNVAIESVVNLGVLVDKEGVPTTALTGKKHIKFIENGVASSEYKYSVKDNDVYMYVSLVHVPKNYFHNKFVCRAYYETETGEVVYSDTLERSVTYVIKEAIADETENAPTAEQKALLEKLRNASEDHIYTASYGEIVTPATDEAQGTRKAFCACGKEGVAPIGLYHYQFDTDGGIAVDAIDGSSYDTISVLPTPERSGAEFLGWYNEAGEKVERIDVPYEEGVTGETVTLKAKWLVYLTEEELAAGYSFDGAEKIGRVKANSADTVISYDETKNAMAIAQGGSGESRLVRLSGLISLKKGESVHLLMDSYNSTNNGGGLRIMYSDNIFKSQEIKRTAEGFAYLSWTADRDYDNVYIGYINYVNTTYYLRCIAVAKTQNLTIAQLEAGYTFDNPAKVLGKMTCTQGSAQYDLEKNAMKLTQWGGSLAINVDTFTLDAGDSIVIAYSSDTKGGFSLSGTYKADIPANGTEFIWTVTEAISISSVGLKSYTQNKDLFVVSIQVVRKTNISVTQLESGFAFDDQSKIATYTTCEAGIMASYDAEKNAMLIKPSKSNKTVSINVDTITLNAGDKIVVKVWCLISSDTNASFVTTTADGKKSYTNIYANTGFQEYAYTAAAECTVTDLQIIPYTASGELYVQSIQIVRANAN